MKITAESQLRLDNVKFVVDGKSKSISEGDTRKDVSPGSKLEIKGDILNDFSRDDDITIDDVTIEITNRISMSKKYGLLIHFDDIRREFRNEKLLMLYILTLTFLRPNCDLENIQEM